MKGNDGSGNIVERDVWQTPQKMWDKLNEQYNFTFDCCANSNNTKCKDFSSKLESEGLYPANTKLLEGVNWMNPPFSKAFDMFKYFFELTRKGVAIYRCDNLETKVWQDIILKHADWILIPKGRICYEGMEGKGSRFPSALIGVGVEVPENLGGVILEIKR